MRDVACLVSCPDFYLKSSAYTSTAGPLQTQHNTPGPMEVKSISSKVSTETPSTKELCTPMLAAACPAAADPTPSKLVLTTATTTETLDALSDPTTTAHTARNSTPRAEERTLWSSPTTPSPCGSGPEAKHPGMS